MACRDHHVCSCAHTSSLHLSSAARRLYESIPHMLSSFGCQAGMDAFCATTQYGVCAEDMRTPPYSLYMRVYGSSCSHLQPSSQRVMHCLLCRQLMYACNDLPAPRYLSVFLCYTACALSPHPPTVQHCGVLFSTLSGCSLLLAVPHEACSNLLAFKPLLASSEDSVGCRICEWFFPSLSGVTLSGFTLSGFTLSIHLAP